MEQAEKDLLFNKVPKYEKKERLTDEKLWERQFLNTQISELKKRLFREYVRVWKSKKWAEEDDVDSQRAAESTVKDATQQIKDIKSELSAYEAVLKDYDEGKNS